MFGPDFVKTALRQAICAHHLVLGLHPFHVLSKKNLAIRLSTGMSPAEIFLLIPENAIFCLVLCSVISLERILKVRAVLSCSTDSTRNISLKGNRFFEYPSLGDGVSRLLASLGCGGFNLCASS